MENPAKTLLAGNWIMALCGVFYLAWWVVVFRPPKPRNSPVGWALLALAFLAGIAGFYLMGRTLVEPVSEVNPGVPGRWITLTGAVAYAVLLAGIVLAAAVASLICYLLYYRLPYTPGFIVGCIPLVLAVLTIALVNLTAARTS